MDEQPPKGKGFKSKITEKLAILFRERPHHYHWKPNHRSERHSPDGTFRNNYCQVRQAGEFLPCKARAEAIQEWRL